MQLRSKVLVIDTNCSNLVRLMMWLDQYQEFDVSGSTFESSPFHDMVNDIRPDLIIANLPWQGAEALALSRIVSALPWMPSLVIKNGESGKELSLKSFLADIRDLVMERQSALSAQELSMRKAG